MTTSQLDITNESQEVSPFPAGDHNVSTLYLQMETSLSASLLIAFANSLDPFPDLDLNRLHSDNVSKKKFFVKVNFEKSQLRQQKHDKLQFPGTCKELTLSIRETPKRVLLQTVKTHNAAFHHGLHNFVEVKKDLQTK